MINTSLILNYLLIAIPILPLAISLIIRSFGRAKEMTVSKFALFAVGTYSLMVLAVLSGLSMHSNDIKINIPLFRWGHESFGIDLFLDFGGAVFLGMTAFLCGTVVRFSQRYMHREKGYSRFFSTLLIFVSGMSILSLASNLETLFMGWEIVGISSFLLIGFYRHRRQPIQNAQKTYAIYRLCDVGLLVGALLEHKLLPGGSFSTLQNVAAYQSIASIPETTLFTLSMLILMSASGKSAQFPFSFWLPRAMEGPTPSSAIFYGALSVHAGVLLLYRTYGLWQCSSLAPFFIAGVGLITALLSTGISRVQPTIKGQIAYASITQVGLMFVELALGFPKLALFHFIGNACLRCYQLLVSPSVVTYLLRRQSSTSGLGQIKFSDWSWERILPNKIRSSLFCLVTLEGYLEVCIRRILWRPPIILGNALKSNRAFFYIFAGTCCFALGWSLYEQYIKVLGLLFLILGLIVSIESLSFSRQLSRAWILSGLSSLIMGLGIGISAISSFQETLPFLLGILTFMVLGYGLIKSKKYPYRSFTIFICLLGMTGFPISPVFFGEDLILDVAIHTSHMYSIIFTAGFIVNGIALIKAYSNEFLNPERRMS